MADREGFGEFVATRSRMLLRTAYLLTGDHAPAENLLQTAPATSWFAWARIDGPPEPYVRRVLVTTYATWWRRKWQGERPTGSQPETQVPAVTSVEDREALGRALAVLPRRQRAVVVLRYYEDLSGPTPWPRSASARDREEPGGQGAGGAAPRRRPHPDDRRRGMIEDELRSMLSDRADEAPDNTARVAQVRSRIGAIRRRRTAGAALGLVLLAVAGLALTRLPGRPDALPTAVPTIAAPPGPYFDQAGHPTVPGWNVEQILPSDRVRLTVRSTGKQTDQWRLWPLGP